ncbi:MAG TPA: hypothetical protein VNL38_01320 [Candidatus Nitrosotenuis sp.]|nr:hypothetical protein [Candidatus Nitrosotenuis sp.]
MGCVLALPESVASYPQSGKRRNEIQLAGLRPGRDTLRTAANLYGSFYRKVKPDSELEIAWVDSVKQRVLRVELNEKGVIQAVVVSTLDPLTSDPDHKTDTPLPSPKLATGRGLRIAHENYGDAKDQYGDPDSSEEGKRHGITVEVMTYTFPKEPRFLEIACERGGGRIVQIKLAVAPDSP